MPVVRWDREQATAPVDPMVVDALDGQVLVLDGVSGGDDPSLGWVRRAPCVVIGVAPEGAGPATAADVALGPDDRDELGRILAAAEAEPQAARTLVEVLRAGEGLDVQAALVVESFAYSMLLAGPEFGRWLAARPERSPRRFAEPPVAVQRDGRRLLLGLRRPENRNAFSAELRDALVEALALAEVDDTIEDVHLSAAGPAFGSGGDLTEFGTAPDVVRAHQIRTQRSVGARLARIAGKVTVHVHGPCVGAGVELPAFAGRVVADPATTFRLPEVGMGLIPGAGGTVSIPRRIGRQATARFALVGDELDAEQALAIGLVDELSANG